MLSDATWGVSLSRYGSGDSPRDTAYLRCTGTCVFRPVWGEDVRGWEVQVTGIQH